MIYNAHDTRECHWTMNSIYVFDHSCGKASNHQIYGWYILIDGYTNHTQFINILYGWYINRSTDSKKQLSGSAKQKRLTLGAR